jgi:subtilisin family serine protease
MRQHSAWTQTGATVLIALVGMLTFATPDTVFAQSKGKSDGTPSFGQGGNSRKTSEPYTRSSDRPRTGVIGTGIPVAIGGDATAPNATTTRVKPPPPGRTKPPPQRPASPPTANNRINIPPPNENRLLPDEVVLEFAADLTAQDIAALAARHQLAEIESVNLALTNTIFFRGRITDGRPVRVVLAGLAGEASLRTGQPNYLYEFVQQQSAASDPAVPPALVTSVLAAGAAQPANSDPTLYAAVKLRLSEAHGLAKGNNILVAVIDSGVDIKHPDFQGGIAGSFDALNSPEPPHTHGTGTAGAIGARFRQMGVAPAAQLLAIRAFSMSVGFTFAIIKGIDHAAAQNARIINMSFAGPVDPATLRHLAAAYDKGIVLIAAAGNLGPKAPPQYPAAAPNVIAVSATDISDRLYVNANRGAYVAISAPGVNVQVPAPGGLYQVTSGTSFAAAYISGVAALILERKPSLAPDEVRQLLQSSSKDLGPRGKDDQFGSGRADAYQAILAVER